MARSAAARRRRRAVVRGVVGVTGFAVVVGGGALGVSALLRGVDEEPVVRRCAATADGTAWYLAPDQAETAALLAGTGLRRGLPARAATIALATGMQESRLRNIDHGDRDSVGIFQQRPSQGWGSVEEVLDPVYSTNAFYDALVEVEGYQEMAVTEAAQTVQRSAFPDAYAQHEGMARAWASALTGHSPSAVTCELGEAGAGDPDGLVARLERDLGLRATVTRRDDGTSVVTAESAALPGAEGDADRAAWAVAQWAVAVAEPFGVTTVRTAGSAWERAAGAWADGGTSLRPGRVVVVLAG